MIILKKINRGQYHDYRILLEKLNSSMFEETDLEDILDLRDEEAFDGEWVRVNHLIDQEKRKRDSRRKRKLW